MKDKKEDTSLSKKENTSLTNVNYQREYFKIDKFRITFDKNISINFNFVL